MRRRVSQIGFERFLVAGRRLGLALGRQTAFRVLHDDHPSRRHHRQHLGRVGDMPQGRLPAVESFNVERA